MEAYINATTDPILYVEIEDIDSSNQDVDEDE